MGFPVTRFELTALDPKAARAFYSELFDWKCISQGRAGVTLLRTGDGIDGSIILAEDGMPTFVTIYVEVGDVEVSLARAEQLGGTIYVPAGPSTIDGEGCMGLFGDPEGNLVGVIQR